MSKCMTVKMPIVNQVGHADDQMQGRSNPLTPRANEWVFKKKQMQEDEKIRREKEEEKEKEAKKGILCGLCCPWLWGTACECCCKVSMRDSCCSCCVQCCTCCCQPREKELDEEEPDFNYLRSETLHNIYTGDEMYKVITDPAEDRLFLIHMIYSFLREVGVARLDIHALDSFLTQKQNEIQKHVLLGYHEIAVKGAALPGVFFIQEGEALLTVDEISNKAIHKKCIRLHRGDYFGDAEFILDIPSQFNIHAYKACTFSVLPTNILRRLLAQLQPHSVTYDPISWYTKRRYPFAPNIRNEPSSIKGRTWRYRELSPMPKEHHEAGLEVLNGQVVEFRNRKSLLLTRWMVERTAAKTKTVDETPALYTKYQEKLFVSVLKQTDLFGDWPESELLKLLAAIPADMESGPFQEFAKDEVLKTRDGDFTYIVYRGKIKAVIGRNGMTILPDLMYPTVLHEEKIFFDEQWGPRWHFVAGCSCYVIAIPMAILLEYPSRGKFTKQISQWNTKFQLHAQYSMSKNMELVTYLESELSEMTLKLSSKFRLVLPKTVQDMVRRATAVYVPKDYYIPVEAVARCWLMMYTGVFHHVRRKDRRERGKWKPYQVFEGNALIEKQQVNDGFEFMLYAMEDVFCIAFMDNPTW